RCTRRAVCAPAPAHATQGKATANRRRSTMGGPPFAAWADVFIMARERAPFHTVCLKLLAHPIRDAAHECATAPWIAHPAIAPTHVASPTTTTPSSGV